MTVLLHAIDLAGILVLAIGLLVALVTTVMVACSADTVSAAMPALWAAVAILVLILGLATVAQVRP